VLSVAALALTAALGLRSNGIADRAADQSRQANEIAASAQTLRPHLTVNSVRTDLATDLKGVNSEGFPMPPNVITDDAAKQATGLRGPRIDVLLANAGQRASVIDVAEVEITFAQSVTGCATGGGGDIQATEYDIPLPQLPHPMPFMVPKSIAYEVDGGGSGRVALTIGQQWTANEESPLVVRARVTLLHDGGERLALGTFAVVDPGRSGVVSLAETGWQIEVPAGSTPQECLHQGAAMIRQIMSEPGIIVTDELKSLSAALSKY
jgi:hypothetical protein